MRDDLREARLAVDARKAVDTAKMIDVVRLESDPADSIAALDSTTVVSALWRAAHWTKVQLH